MPVASLTVADGQAVSVATAAAISATTAVSARSDVLIHGANAPVTGRVDIVIHNTGTSTQTVLLTFRRAGGTARRLVRAILEESEQLIVGGVPLQPDDAILMTATSASTVDYLVTASSGGGFRVELLSANGTGKGTGTLRQLLLGTKYLVGGDLPDPGE